MKIEIPYSSRFHIDNNIDEYFRTLSEDLQDKHLYLKYMFYDGPRMQIFKSFSTTLKQTFLLELKYDMPKFRFYIKTNEPELSNKMYLVDYINQERKKNLSSVTIYDKDQLLKEVTPANFDLSKYLIITELEKEN